MPVFWDVALCGFIKIDQCYLNAYYFHICVMIEAVSTSETPIDFYASTWCNIPEERHKNLKSHYKFLLKTERKCIEIYGLEHKTLN
jgi:hypothetical protein